MTKQYRKTQNKRSMMNEHNLFKKMLNPVSCRDLRVNNARKKSSAPFWDITKEKIAEMTAAKDRRHSEGSTSIGETVVNMAATVISAADLYKIFKKKLLTQA